MASTDQKLRIIPTDEEHLRTRALVPVSPQFFGWLTGLGGGVTIEGLSLGAIIGVCKADWADSSHSSPSSSKYWTWLCPDIPSSMYCLQRRNF